MKTNLPMLAPGLFFMMALGVSFAQEPPAVTVKAYQRNQADGTVRYQYRIVNGGTNSIVGVVVGNDYFQGVSELKVTPSGWNFDTGLALGGTASPPFWHATLITTEESPLVELEWRNDGTADILPGQTVSGFSVITPQSDSGYLSGHWTVFFADSTIESAVLVLDDNPAPSAVAPLQSPGSLDVRASSTTPASSQNTLVTQEATWSLRKARFVAIKQQAHGQYNQSEQAELLALFKKETDLLRDFVRRYRATKTIDDGVGDGYESYYDDLEEVVLSFADFQDPKVLRTFALSIYGPGSQVAKKIAAQKEKALPVVDDLWQANLLGDRENAVGIMTSMIQDPSLGCETKRKVTARIISLAHDQDSSVRREVVRGLVSAGTPEAMVALKDMSESDPDSSPRGENGAQRYPIRELAKRHLEQRKKNGALTVNDPCLANAGTP